MSKSVLLLGGSGFLGRALVRSLEKDATFTVAYSGTRELPNDPRHVRIDLISGDGTERMKDFDIVVNLTGQNVQPFSLCHALNTDGMRHMLDVLRPEQFFVQVSTLGVYGSADAVNEQSSLRPETPYAEAKLEAENILRQVRSDHTYLIVRLCNLYGSGQDKGLPWYIVDCIRKKQEVAIADNNGQLRRHFLHVDDAAAYVHALIVAGTRGVINIAGSENISIREMVALAEHVIGTPIVARYGNQSPMGNIGLVNLQVLHAAVSVRPQTSFEQFLKESLIGGV